MSIELSSWRGKTARAEFLASKLPDGTILAPWSTIQTQALPLYDFNQSKSQSDLDLLAFFVIPQSHEEENINQTQAAR